MKFRKLSLIMCLVLLTSLFTACSGNEKTQQALSWKANYSTFNFTAYKDGVFFQTPLRSVGVAPANIGFNGLRQNDRYEFPVYDGKMPFLIDEVGGIKWAKDQERESQTESWGYGKPPKSEAEFLQRLEGQIGAVLELADQVWGYCYTQLTDVEQEQNGVYYYDRTPKFDTERIRAIFGRNPGDKALKKD